MIKTLILIIFLENSNKFFISFFSKLKMEDLIHDINEIDHLLTVAKRHVVVETLKNKK